MKTIDTLVQDILSVVDQKGGWDAAASQYLASRLAVTLDRRLKHPPEERKEQLRMSSIGKPCTRQLWYSINTPTDSEELRSETKLKFLYGDILEDLLIALAVAAGHTVTGEQDELEIGGIKGHRDCVIDGVTVDVKSASPYSFKKFKAHGLREDDAFGYISQLSSYVYAAKDDPLVVDKKGGAFLVIDKVNGTLCLDYYTFEDELNIKEIEVYTAKTAVSLPTPPPRSFTDVEEGKSGNRKLDVNCSYCAFKNQCWPGLRTFAYSYGPIYLTVVKNTPKVPEV